ncbi:olfactory receptor 5V1-like [Rhinophrynus dorsalis]
MVIESEYRTNLTTFFLLGFSDLSPEIQFLLFMFLFSVYILTFLGNGLIIVSVTFDQNLNTPMYFFLRNLSFLELCFITVTVPKALENFLSKEKSISFLGCAFQMFIFFTIAVAECVFLTAMAFDRYVAICNPLRYMSIMSKKMCYQLAIGSWVMGFLVSLGQTSFIFSLPYCGPNHISHFFCDIPPLLRLACTNTFNNELSVFIACVLGAVIPFILIMCSYVNILSSILRIHSEEGRHKAMSTCSSHLVSVLLFYGTAMFVYLRLGANGSTGNDRMIALIYCIIIPAINPLIYSLRNTDMKKALRKRLKILSNHSET